MSEVKEVKKLTDFEMLQLERLHSKQNLLEKDLIIKGVHLEKLKVQKKLITAEYTLKTNEIVDSEKELENLRNEFNGQKEIGKKFIANLSKEKELEGPFGYDPLSGEIKE